MEPEADSAAPSVKFVSCFSSLPQTSKTCLSFFLSGTFCDAVLFLRFLRSRFVLFLRNRSLLGRLFVSYFCNAGNLDFTVHIHQLDTGRDPSHNRNAGAWCTDNDSLCGNHHNLIILIDCLGTDQVSGLFGNLIAFDTLAAAELYGKLCHRRPFAHAVSDTTRR